MTGNKFISLAAFGKRYWLSRVKQRNAVSVRLGILAPALVGALSLASLALPVASAQERQSLLLNYSDFAQILLISPGDACLENGEDEHCLLLQKNDGTPWPGLEYPIEEVSVPVPGSESIVAGRHNDEFGWFVYDFGLEDYVDSPLELDEALDIYASLGLAPPDFIDAIDARTRFSVAGTGGGGLENFFLALVGVMTSIALILFVVVALILWLLGGRLSSERLGGLRRALWILAVITALGWIVVLLTVVLLSGG